MSDESNKIKKGTTTVGLVGKDCIILAADKRVTAGHLNAHEMTKIYRVTDKIALTMAGGVGDSQMLLKYLKSQMNLYRLRKKSEPTIKSCATFLSNVVYSGKGGWFPYYIQMLIAGVNEDFRYSLYVLSGDGALIKDDFISTGSGSVMAYGILDDSYKKSMSKEELIKIAVRAINVATKRDIYTGNGISVFVINASGVNELSEAEVRKVIAK